MTATTTGTADLQAMGRSYNSRSRGEIAQRAQHTRAGLGQWAPAWRMVVAPPEYQRTGNLADKRAAEAEVLRGLRVVLDLLL